MIYGGAGRGGARRPDAGVSPPDAPLYPVNLLVREPALMYGSQLAPGAGIGNWKPYPLGRNQYWTCDFLGRGKKEVSDYFLDGLSDREYIFFKIRKYFLIVRYTIFKKYYENNVLFFTQITKLKNFSC